MDLQLDGKLALVTASSGGIGFEIARSLAAEGARVILTVAPNPRSPTPSAGSGR
jgi:NAD(P)-dependent dehydrogenase (short-subunit alcohol dehydrogenase family)